MLWASDDVLTQVAVQFQEMVSQPLGWALLDQSIRAGLGSNFLECKK